MSEQAPGIWDDSAAVYINWSEEDPQVAVEVEQAWKDHEVRKRHEAEMSLREGLQVYRHFRGSTPKALRDSTNVNLGPNGLKPIAEEVVDWYLQS